MTETALRFNPTAAGAAAAFDSVIDLPSVAARSAAPARPSRLQTTGVRHAGLPNPLNHLPVENRLKQVGAVLESKQLAGSFVAHLKDQLHRDGVIRIAVVDDFSAGQTHGTNVEARILANVPGYLKDRVRIVRYNVGGQDRAGRARVLQRAATAAQNKEVVAVSVSGGMQAYGVASIERWVGGPLDRSSVRRAFDATAQRAALLPEERAAWASLARASQRVPVVTPVWNDGNTTLAALTLAGSNGVVTSIDRGHGSEATEVPLADIRMPAQWRNTKTSQSAPTFIGQALGLLNERSARQAIHLPPRDSGFRNGGLPQ